MVSKVFLLLFFATFTFVKSQRSNEAIDSVFLESVLDAEECDRQIRTIRRNVLIGLQFADAGIRIPKGILQGGTVDLGNYHQCLAIEHSLEDNMHIQGKYCAIRVPVDQALEIPGFESPRERWMNNPGSYMDQNTSSIVDEYNLRRARILALDGDFDALEEYNARTSTPNPLSGTVFTLGVCVPKVCTTQQALTSLLFNATEIGFEYTENYCRLRGDKPFSTADIVAVAIFSFIAFINLLSTSYDLYQRFFLKTDVKAINPVYQSFSVYTNSQRLMTISSGSGTMQCIDGIRTIAMMWVIIGHSFSTEPYTANPRDSFLWMISAEGLWVTAATMTVDTFFTLGGILLVYTTVGKMTGTTLFKNLHWFYLNRVVRLLPILAVTVLLQASFFNHVTDGPFWQTVANQTNRCRNYWWYTLLFVQNVLNNRSMCTGHAWYVAIDAQVYFISPLVLFWVFSGNKRKAWFGLLGGLLAIQIGATIFNFNKSLQAGVIVPGRGEDTADYMPLYYFNPLTRAGPFFVGLVFGYVLHLYRGKKVNMPWVLAVFFWACFCGILGGIFYFKYRIMQFDWDNQFMDNFMNSFMRPAWACAISWLIFACVHGYSGPINWFLSLDVWKVPAKLTYGMYLLHYPFMFSFNATMITPKYFSVGGYTFKFLSYMVIALAVSYVATVMVDSPISALYRQLMIKIQKKRAPPNGEKVMKEQNNNNEKSNIVQMTADGATAGTDVPAVTIK
ncbi:O-acyltransferase like protein-like [Anticarsia gemmatalis]|uniref:O-acyltransferase like protein-like n=1 Tax=Anticarsia gemmatalis TaxID=129554 RepID=UPI003F75E89B